MGCDVFVRKVADVGAVRNVENSAGVERRGGQGRSFWVVYQDHCGTFSDSPHCSKWRGVESLRQVGVERRLRTGDVLVYPRYSKACNGGLLCPR